MSTLSPPLKNRRFFILSLIFFSVVINYMDRMTMSVAKPILMSGDSGLGLSDIEAGYIMSVFALSYSLSQLPGGFIIDLIKIRILYPVLMVLWSIASLLQGFASGVAGLVGCRIAIGVFEAPSFPCNNKIVTQWFPEKERATAIGSYTSGQYLGLAFLMPMLGLLLEYLGWRGMFIVTGAIGVVWAAVLYFVYRDPQDDTKLSKEELEYIQQDKQDDTDSSEQDQQSLGQTATQNIIAAFSSYKLWALYLGQFGLGGSLAFFFFWMPDFMNKLEFSVVESGFAATPPFIAAFFGVLLAGFASDRLEKRGFSKEFARKAPIALGLIMATSIAGASFTDNRALIIMFLSISSFGTGLASIAWVFVSLLAPARQLGIVGGCFNLAGGLGATLAITLTGHILDATDRDFGMVLYLVAGFAALSFTSYVVLLGKLEKVSFSAKTSAATH